MSELEDKTKKKEKHKFVTLIEKAYEDAEKKYKNLCVDIQQQDSNSMLSFTKEQIALRKKIAT